MTTIARLCLATLALTVLIFANSSVAGRIAANAHTDKLAAAAQARSPRGFFSSVVADAYERGADDMAGALAADTALMSELADQELIPAEAVSGEVWRGNPAEMFFGNLYNSLRSDIEVAIETDRYLSAQAIQFLLQPK